MRYLIVFIRARAKIFNYGQIALRLIKCTSVVLAANKRINTTYKIVQWKKYKYFGNYLKTHKKK